MGVLGAANPGEGGIPWYCRGKKTPLPLSRLWFHEKFCLSKTREDSRQEIGGGSLADVHHGGEEGQGEGGTERIRHFKVRDGKKEVFLDQDYFNKGGWI